MAKNKGLNPNLLRYYSFTSINKIKRAGFIFLALTCYTLMALAFGKFFLAKTQPSWSYLALALTLIGLPLVFFPQVEKWEYRPWQAKAQKYERHHRF